MIIIAAELVNPIFLNNQFRVDIDEIYLSEEDNHFNPTIKSFNEDSNIKVQIEAFTTLSCNDIIGTVFTQRESISMDCNQSVTTGFNTLVFSLPSEGETDFKYEDYPLLSSNKDYIVHKFIEI